MVREKYVVFVVAILIAGSFAASDGMAACGSPKVCKHNHAKVHIVSGNIVADFFLYASAEAEPGVGSGTAKMKGTITTTGAGSNATKSVTIATGSAGPNGSSGTGIVGVMSRGVDSNGHGYVTSSVVSAGAASDGSTSGQTGTATKTF